MGQTGKRDTVGIIWGRHTIKKYELRWSPNGQLIATVEARTERAAIRMAPKPYRRYLGEIYAVEA